jgi:hypothetical protein
VSPVNVPVCEAAIRRARSLRPSLIATIGLPASRQRRAAAKNSSGRRIFSMARPITRVAGSSAK